MWVFYFIFVSFYDFYYIVKKFILKILKLFLLEIFEKKMKLFIIHIIYLKLPKKSIRFILKSGAYKNREWGKSFYTKIFFSNDITF